MNKYINASEAEMIIESEAEYLYGEGLDVSAYRMWKLQNQIRDIPSADVRENIHGEWETIDYDDGEYEFRCSSCQSQYDMPSKTNFCPNCGADMRGETDG